MNDNVSSAYLNNRACSLFDHIQEWALIGTWETDIHTLEISWSDVSKRIYEVPFDFVPTLENSISFFKKGSHRSKIKKLFTKCIENFEPFDENLEIITAQGNHKLIRVIGTPSLVKDGKKRIFGAFQNLEKTSNSKKNIIQEEEFKKTFEFASIGMALVSLNGNWLKVNKSLCKMLGYTEKQLLSLSKNDIIHPDDQSISKQISNQLRRGDLNSLDIEKRYIHKNGSTVYVGLSISVVNNDLDKPMHYVYQINNITNVKTAQDEIKELLDISEKQNKQLLNFAHIVSHNLRSHYSNMEMLANLMEIKNTKSSDNEMFPLLREAINHLGETVDNLNQITLIRANENINTIKVNLSDAVNSSISSIKGSLIKHNASVNIKISKNIHVKVVPAYLDSIIMNLLTNSIRFRSKDRSLKIEIIAKIRAKHTLVEFKDNGLGIDLNLHKNRIFGMYNTFHDHKDAKGLGLFITKNQIEAIGGSISVESEVNAGTKFLISLKT